MADAKVFTIEINGLSKLNKALKDSPKTVVDELKNAIKTSVNMIRPMMFRNAPVATSKLRRNIYARHSGLTGEVGPNLRVTPYAWWVHEGTGPFDIRPRTKQALYWKGAAHPVMIVHHPGIKANPFVEETAREAKSPVNRIFQNSVQKIVEKLTA